MSKEFGNKWKQLRSMVLFGIVFGVILIAVFAGFNIYKGRPVNWLQVAGIGGGIGLALPLFVLPTLLVSIRIEDGVISHWLLGRWKLGEGRVEDLTRMEVAVGTGAKFYFSGRSGKSTISFMGADLLILQDMCLHILELRPDFNEFYFGARAAMILKAVNAFQSNRQAGTIPANVLPTG